MLPLLLWTLFTWCRECYSLVFPNLISPLPLYALLLYSKIVHLLILMPLALLILPVPLLKSSSSLRWLILSGVDLLEQGRSYVFWLVLLIVVTFIFEPRMLLVQSLKCPVPIWIWTISEIVTSRTYWTHYRIILLLFHWLLGPSQVSHELIVELAESKGLDRLWVSLAWLFLCHIKNLIYL